MTHGELAVRSRATESAAVRRGTLRIDPLPPFRLDLTVWALRRRPRNRVDVWDGTSYRRALVVAGSVVELSLEQDEDTKDPRLGVMLAGRKDSPSDTGATRSIVDRLLGLHVDLTGFYRLAEPDDAIGPIVNRFRGLKPPCFPTVFEAVVNAVALQQLSLEAGLSILNRLPATYGAGVSPRPPHLRSFPTAGAVARLEPPALRSLGFSAQKARTIIAIARDVVAGHLDLEGLEHASNAEAFSVLTSLGGIGRWSAEYVLLRGLGRLDVFPGDDVGARSNLARRLGLEGPLDYDSVAEAVSCWQPYAGLAYFHLLLDGLEVRGRL